MNSTRKISVAIIAFLALFLYGEVVQGFQLPKPSHRLQSSKLILQNNADSMKNILAGDNIFRIHAVGGGVFGGTLLAFPGIFMQGNPIAEFTYQSWSIFILSVATLAWFAPSFQAETKSLMARVFFLMFLSETVLYINELVQRSSLLAGSFLIATGGSAIIFGFLSIGYLASGVMLTKESIPQKKIEKNEKKLNINPFNFWKK
jgi:hypothetical protein